VSYHRVMNRRRVLIVDDERELRTMPSAYLIADGFEVLEAADGEQAVELAQSGIPTW